MITVAHSQLEPSGWAVYDGNHRIDGGYATEPEARRAAGLFAASVADERTGPTLAAHLRASADQSGRFFAGPNGIFPHRNRGAADHARSRFHQLAADCGSNWS